MILDKDIVCFCCDETFTAEDDYKTHMIKDHGIRKNIDNCVNVAKKKAGLPVIIKQEVIEEVTLDDSDEDDASDDIIVDNQHLATDSFNKIESEAKFLIWESVSVPLWFTDNSQFTGKTLLAPL